MPALHTLESLGHEEVVLVHDRATGLRAVIAIHDTTLGPAVGGTRMRVYPDLDAAVVDALRLSRAMTYKAAAAEMPYGGGKAVILADPARDKGPALLAAYARAVERLGGRFMTGADMGVDGSDVAFMARHTEHVSHTAPGQVDTAELAALGVLESVRAVGALLGRDTAGLRVAVQGLGAVGMRLCRMLAAEGARLLVADLDAGRVAQALAELGAEAASTEAIFGAEADVFSPNAAGSCLDDTTIARLRCKAVAGGANDQLAEPRHGDALHARGILYAPDYVVNAGGLLSLLYEKGETDLEGVRARVRAIGPRVRDLLERSRAAGVAPHRLADRLVEQRLEMGRDKRVG